MKINIKKGILNEGALFTMEKARLSIFETLFYFNAPLQVEWMLLFLIWHANNKKDEGLKKLCYNTKTKSKICYYLRTEIEFTVN